MKLRSTIAVGLALCATVPTLADDKSAGTPDPNALVVVVMDPLAKPLSCPCVEGYAQRDYDKLGEHLGKLLGRPVNVQYSDSLVKALQTKTGGRADVVIGKKSVVEFDAKRSRKTFKQVAALTGKDGDPTQHGLIVVPKDDPAKAVKDLKNYRIIFGPKEADEKHSAALAVLKKNGVEPPKTLEMCDGCADGATKILDAGPSVRGAAVISSYAAPLLEGCGTVKKGDLRVVGKTEPVPFVVAFVSEELPSADRETIAKGLLAVQDDPALCLALETLGFNPAEKPKAKAAATVETAKKN
jgi:ABC-type phosphate/phosphonate transport system substrate-binding protein